MKKNRTLGTKCNCSLLSLKFKPHYVIQMDKEKKIINHVIFRLKVDREVDLQMLTTTMCKIHTHQ